MFQDRSPIAALRQAVPYLKLFQGSVFVIKASGEVFTSREAARMLLEQIRILHQLGIRVVLVHGGGPQTTALSRDLGVEPRFVKGRRVTCERTREISTMVLNGTVNTTILAACRELDLPAVGLSGIDCGLVDARRRPPVDVDGETVDYGFVGDIEAIRPELLESLTLDGYLPVVSPLSADDQGTVLNLNADGIATEIAIALEAAKLLFMTGAPGILRDPTSNDALVSMADLSDLEQLRQDGALRDGMLPKSDAIERALRGGVPRVHVLSYKVPDSLLLEVFTNEGCGTMVVEERASMNADAATAGS